jgi:putative membrane protein
MLAAACRLEVATATLGQTEGTAAAALRTGELIPMMWGYHSGTGGWIMFWMILSTFVWLALIAVAVWALVRWVSHASRAQGSAPPHGSTTKPSAEEIVRQRYARGQIDAATFEQVREHLDAFAEKRSVGIP